MPLELQTPNLDASSYDEIRRRAMLRIPRYTPEWTDHNESDPGVAFVELFAWLAESLYFQMNQVPKRIFLKFLQQMGMELQPARPATAQLVFMPTPGIQSGPVPERTRLSAQPASGGDPLIFETSAGLGIVPLLLTDVQVFDGAGFTRVSDANAAPGITFRPFGWTPQVGSALYLGFTPPQTNNVNPAAGGASSTPIVDFPEVISWFVWRPVSVANAQAVSARDVQIAPAPPVQLVWEYRPQNEPTRWRRLQVFKDESVAFTRDGVIQVEGPVDPAITPEGRVVDPRYWFRVRIDTGSYPVGHEPQLDFIRVNVVSAENLSTVAGENLGFTLGIPSQTFQLERTPVQTESLVLTINDLTESDPAKPWTLVQDFLGSGPDDNHFTMDAVSGEIRLGDGSNGRIPSAGSAVTAETYRSGGGMGGNLGPGQIGDLLTSIPGVDSVSNPRKATGGCDEQTIDEFLRIAPAQLRHHNQAISANDLTAMANQVGGIARAKALPLFHPDFPGVEVPGAVTIVVLPISDAMPPIPTQEDMEQVIRQLEPNRLLTLELLVKGPAYHKIQVQAQVEADPYAAFDQVRNQVIEAINRELSPLTRDFGMDLYPTQFYNVIQNVRNVRAVSYLSIRVDGQPHDVLEEPVVLSEDEMLYGLADHDIRVTPYQEQ